MLRSPWRAGGPAGAWLAPLVALALASGADAREGEAGFGVDFSGRYQHVGGEAEERAVREAIERTISELGWLTRRFARERLREGARIPERIEIDVDREVVTIREEDREYSAPCGGVTTLHRPKAGRVEVQHELGPTQLSQIRSTDQGARRATYRLDDDGQRLVATVVTTSPHLPTALVYQLTYERAPARR
jgi:hypothetical protein